MFSCVAGVYAPAFVERVGRQGNEILSVCVAGVYAPAFVERSLAGVLPVRIIRGVAGVYAPAFVERCRYMIRTFWHLARVAGVYAPAFVERLPLASCATLVSHVSLGFMLQPSLSGAFPSDNCIHVQKCRWGLCSSLR